MLWYKSWIDTRWRFLLGLALLLVLACGTVASFPAVQQIAASLPAGSVAGDDSLQREIQESLEAIRTFRGYAWSQWFAGNFLGLLTIVAALLGSGSPLVKAGRGALFSLALPVSRDRWIVARAGTGLGELFVLALAPSVAISLVASLVGQEFSLADAVVYGLSAFVVASLFFGVALYLSTVFDDVWRPLLLTCLVAAAVAVAGRLLLPESQGLFQAMAGRAYYYTGSLPWPELLISAAGAAALAYAAAATISRRDF